MNKSQFFDLAERYSRNECTTEEVKLFETFYTQMQQNPKDWDNWNLTEKDKSRLSILQKINRHIDSSELENVPQIGKHRTIYRSIAASIALLVVSGWIYFNILEEDPLIPYITKTTMRGQKATITLSDGSTVRLNAESSITFPEKFSEDERVISLTGEAFFEVEKNPSKPFIVSSGDIQTKVLGTSFNINAYPERDEIDVTVASGKVKVSKSPSESDNLDVSRNAIILTTGEQATYSSLDHELTSSKVNLEKFMAWKEGIIIFDDIPMAEAFDYLERWFNVTIDDEDIDISNCFVKSSYDTKSLENIMESLSFINGLDYQKTNEKILITKSSCL